jgi:hypothetical protein
VVARPSALVEGEAGIADVRHHRVALGLDYACAEDALVEAGGRIGIVRLEGGVVEARHRDDDEPGGRGRQPPA